MSEAGIQLLTWSAAFEVGDITVDAEHRMLVELYNDIIRAIGRQISSTMWTELIASLERYATLHFAHEEREMRDTGYPHADDHTLRHHHFLTTLRCLEQKPACDTASATIQFLNGWFLEHVAQEDRAVFTWIAAVRRPDHHDVVITDCCVSEIGRVPDAHSADYREG